MMYYLEKSIVVPHCSRSIRLRVMACIETKTSSSRIAALSIDTVAEHVFRKFLPLLTYVRQSSAGKRESNSGELGMASIY